MVGAQNRGEAHIAHIRHEAETLLSQVRAALMAELETRAAELRAAIEHPAPELDFARLRRDISAFNEILRARRADQLGESVILPLEEYPLRIRSLGGRLGIWPADATLVKRRWRTVAGIELLPTRRGFAIWLIGLAVAWGASAYYLGLFPSFQEIRLDAAPPENGIVHVTCRNTRMHYVTLYIPGSPGMLPPESSTDYALVLYIREKTGEDYRLLPPIPNAWTVQGEKLHETTPVEIGPLMSCDLAVSLANIRETIGVSFSQARLVLVRSGGAIAAACEMENFSTPGI